MICVEWPWAADHFGLGLMYVDRSTFRTTLCSEKNTHSKIDVSI